MVRRLSVGAVIAAGLFVVALGVQRWLDAHAAESVVHELMRAVESGERQAAIELLCPDRRNLLEMETADDEPNRLWPRQQGVTWQIRGVQIAGDSAVASLSVKKDGFVVRPAIYLRRGKTSRWKIDRIENLHVDPRFTKMHRDHQCRQGEQLADELQQALKGRSGVAVERIALPEIPATRVR